MSPGEGSRIARRAGQVVVGAGVDRLSTPVSTRIRATPPPILHARLEAGIRVESGELTPVLHATLKHAASMPNPVGAVVSARRFRSPLGAGGRSADMMSVLERQHSSPDPGAESTRPDSRLVFPPSSTAHGVLDGSWWPRTRDPAAELPALIAAVADRLGVVGRIALNADAWDTRPQRITTVDQQVVRLDWSGAWDAHAIRLIGCDSSHLDLLVIPPDTATVLALTCLAIAAAPNTSPKPTTDLSATCTPVTLWSVPPPVGRSRRAKREQADRWETDGGRVRS